MGTKARIKIEIKNKKNKNLINLFFSGIEIKSISNNEIETKKKKKKMLDEKKISFFIHLF